MHCVKQHHRRRDSRDDQKPPVYSDCEGQSKQACSSRFGFDNPLQIPFASEFRDPAFDVRISGTFLNSQSRLQVNSTIDCGMCSCSHSICFGRVRESKFCASHLPFDAAARQNITD